MKTCPNVSWEKKCHDWSDLITHRFVKMSDVGIIWKLVTYTQLYLLKSLSQICEQVGWTSAPQSKNAVINKYKTLKIHPFNVKFLVNPLPYKKVVCRYVFNRYFNLVMEEHWSSATHIKNFPRHKKVLACDLKCRYCIFTQWGRPVIMTFLSSTQIGASFHGLS